VIDHRHGDLIAIVEAGASLAAVNAALAARGQWLAVESSFPDATIGGILATNDAGPLRHRFGTPRDQLLGVTLATTDGHVVKAGGAVVKNVAGFDLGRLVSGSHGTLAAIVTATFKLAPRLLASQTVRVRCGDGPQAASCAALVAASQWEPVAVDVRADSDRPTVDLLLRFASTADAVNAQVRAVVAAFTRGVSAAVDVVDGDAEAGLWHEQGAGFWASDDLVVRCGWRPASLDAIVAIVHAMGADDGVHATLAGRAGIGAGLVRLSGALPGQLRAIARLRAARPQIDHVVLLRAAPAVKQQIDVWGDLGASVHALRAIKRMLDPADILNAGRGPL
jgi:glycolate oxidase FAD binding subunit